MNTLPDTSTRNRLNKMLELGALSWIINLLVGASDETAANSLSAKRIHV